MPSASKKEPSTAARAGKRFARGEEALKPLTSSLTHRRVSTNPTQVEVEAIDTLPGVPFSFESLEADFLVRE